MSWSKKDDEETLLSRRDKAKPGRDARIILKHFTDQTPWPDGGTPEQAKRLDSNKRIDAERAKRDGGDAG